jgi:hypothetical protein
MGGIIFNFIGASVRWLYGTIWRTIARKKRFTFREYVYGPDHSDDWYDMTGHSFINKIVGILTIVLICSLLVKLSI